MSKIKKLVASPAVTIGALALAVILLAFSAIGGTRAALTYYSENYVSTVQMHELDVALVENGKIITEGALLAKGNLILKGAEAPEGDNEPFKLGAYYQEELAVQNPGNGNSNITQYVRVTIQRYWVDPDLSKSPELDPKLIELNILSDNGNGWIKDTEVSSDERIVLYYMYPLEPGDTTSIFADTLRISPDVQVTVTQDKTDGGTISNTYVYNNASFQLEVKVDAVQDHNVEDAILSAWGRRVTTTIDGDGNKILSLS